MTWWQFVALVLGGYAVVHVALAIVALCFVEVAARRRWL